MISVKEVLKKLKEIFSPENIVNAAKNIYVMISAFVILVVLLLILIFSHGSEKASKKSVLPAAALQDDLILPEEPGIKQEFQYYHLQKTKWSDEDAEQWFVKPNSQMMEELSNSNDKLISDVLEAAP